MKQIVTILFLVLGNSAIGQTKSNTDSLTVVEPIHQLRIYQIPKENRANFHKRFSEHAIRIMKNYGFTIVATWESEYKEKVEFVYLLEWKNKDFMKMAWNNFMADQEWKDIKAQTSKMYGNFVDNIEDRTLNLTKYSPQTNLLKRHKNKTRNR
jgi:NIPSNAP